MKLVTYQKKEAYEKLINTGSLKITKNERNLILPYNFKNDQIKDAYDFIVENMKNIKGRDDDIIYPIWAWYRFEGEKLSPKYNDINYNGKYKITIEVDKSRVLLSDFDKFASILNNPYLAKHRINEWYYNKHYKKYNDEDLKKTWNFIFKTFHLFNGYSYFSFKKRSIQATLWKINKEDIIDVKFIENEDLKNA